MTWKFVTIMFCEHCDKSLACNVVGMALEMHAYKGSVC